MISQPNPNHRPNAARTDEQLLLSYRDSGEERAFASLVRRVGPPMFRYVTRYVGRASLAEEILQSTLLRLHQRQHEFDADRRLQPWLYRIATNQAVDAIRRERKHDGPRFNDLNADATPSARSWVDLLASSEPSPLERAGQREEARWVRQAVASLPDKQREVIQLIFLEGHSYREAADSLGVTLGTIKSRVHNALNTLRRVWNESHPQSRVSLTG